MPQTEDRRPKGPSHSELLSDTPETVLIPAGPFWMGSLLDDPQAYSNEKPRFERDIPEYRIGRYPVTNIQYACFLSANSTHPVPYSDNQDGRPYSWDPESRTYPEDKADHPVVLVSWHDTVAYCQWLCQITGQYYRLPTEEEWEKAARGALEKARRYPWGNEWQAGYCNTQELGHNGTTPVHEFEETNQSPFEIVDMAGNICEWTSSWYERYPNSPHQSLHYGRICRVVRGGSWISSCQEARVSFRGRYKPDVKRPYLGFRVALITLETTVQRPDTGRTPRQVNQKDLFQFLIKRFDLEELRTLCFKLGVDYDTLRGEGKEGKARELIMYLDRKERIPELVNACQQEHPDAFQ